VGIGVPTMVVTETDSATGREGVRLGAAVHAAEDLEGMAATMALVRDGGWPAPRVPRETVGHGHLAAALEEILRSFVEPVPTSPKEMVSGVGVPGVRSSS
jgi:hypothetical protein